MEENTKPVAVIMPATARKAFKLQAIEHDMTLADYMEALSQPLDALHRSAATKGLRLLDIIEKLALADKNGEL